MSISLDSTPRTIAPVYNPIYYKISSNNSSYINYKYTFNLFSGLTATGNPVSTIRLNPRPDGTCLYNPARVLESFVGPDFNIVDMQVGKIDSINQFKPYCIGFNEEYNGVRFSDNTFKGNVGFVIVGDNPFLTGDTVNIVQDPGYTFSAYNGTATITAVDFSSVTTNKSWQGNSPVNPGTIYFTNGAKVVQTGTTYSADCFNGVFQYLDFNDFAASKYIMDPNAHVASDFLTNQPRSGIYVKNLWDCGTLTYLTNGYPHNGSQLFHLLKVYNITGGTPTQYFTNISGGTMYGMHHLPAGPYNLNGLGYGFVIDDTTDHYTIQIVDLGAGHLISEIVPYYMDKRCSKYETIRLQFLNPFGCWDYVNFDLLSKTTINVTRNTFKKNLPYNYSVGDREKTILDIDGNYVYTVTSNWMNDAQSAWMEELFRSQNVNIIVFDAANNIISLHPVNIQEGSLEIQKTINNKMINYTFNLESAYSVNGART